MKKLLLSALLSVVFVGTANSMDYMGYEETIENMKKCGEQEKELTNSLDGCIDGVLKNHFKKNRIKAFNLFRPDISYRMEHYGSLIGSIAASIQDLEDKNWNLKTLKYTLPEAKQKIETNKNINKIKALEEGINKVAFYAGCAKRTK